MLPFVQPSTSRSVAISKNRAVRLEAYNLPGYYLGVSGNDLTFSQLDNNTGTPETIMIERYPRLLAIRSDITGPPNTLLFPNQNGFLEQRFVWGDCTGLTPLLGQPRITVAVARLTISAIAIAPQFRIVTAPAASTAFTGLAPYIRGWTLRNPDGSVTNRIVRLETGVWPCL
jgi:hypothetical protein